MAIQNKVIQVRPADNLNEVNRLCEDGWIVKSVTAQGIACGGTYSKTSSTFFVLEKDIVPQRKNITAIAE